MLNLFFPIHRIIGICKTYNIHYFNTFYKGPVSKIIPHNLSFLLLLLCFHNSTFIHSQRVKEIIFSSDSTIHDERVAQGANRLKGNVEIIINEVIITCDSAYYFPEQKLVDAFSNVHAIKGDSLHLWGNYMQYNGIDSIIRVREDVVLVNKDAKLYTQALNYNIIKDVGHYPVKGQIFSGDNELTSRKGSFLTNIDMALFNDSVVIHTPDYTIYSDSLMYDTKNKIAYFLDSTHIVSNENNIKCDKGWYNTNTRVFMITKNALMENKGRTLEGDSVYYDDNIQFGIARSRVTLTDTTRNILLKGNYAEYYRDPEKAFITDSAVMVQVFEGDSVFLHADTLRLSTDSAGYRIIKAYYKVKYFKSNLQGMCDSLYYSTKDSVLQFHNGPVIWSGENQITANYIEMFLKDNELDHMNILGIAILSLQEDTSKYSQVKGKEMTGYFKNSELYLIDVKGNGQSVYYLKEKEDYIGVNVSICSNLKIYVEQRKPFIIKNLVNPDATLYPLDQAPQEKLILEHFKWMGDYRPLRKEDIFVWK